MTNQIYTREFFKGQTEGSLASARKILPLLFKYISPRQVIDVGCGTGSWLAVARELGVRELFGIDGSSTAPQHPLINTGEFSVADLSTTLDIRRNFDLCISLEVAEHLPATRGESFVSDLCRMSTLVLFSAAIPFQGGTAHINERWLEYWGILFRKQHFVAFDLVRDLVWEDPQVEPWYAQNTLLFVREGSWEQLLPPATRADTRPLSRIHPKIFLTNITRCRPRAIDFWEAEVREFESLTAAYCSGSTEVPEAFSNARYTRESSAGKLQPDEYIDVMGLLSESQAKHDFLTGKVEFLTEEVRITTDALRKFTISSLESSRAATAATTALATISEKLAQREHQLLLLQHPQHTCSLGQHLPQTISAMFRRTLRSLRTKLEPLNHGKFRYAAMKGLLLKGLKGYREIELLMLLEHSNLFDANWYLAHYPEAAHSGLAPLLHYVTRGAAQGLSPHPLFDAEFYANAYPDVVRKRYNPLKHFLLFGGLEGRAPHPLFSSAYYLAQNADVRNANINPLVHYISHGGREGRSPHPLFDGSLYLSCHPELLETSESPLAHFLAQNDRCSQPHPLFLPAFYTSYCPEAATTNPLLHFVQEVKRRKGAQYEVGLTDLGEMLMRSGLANSAVVGTQLMDRPWATLAREIRRPDWHHVFNDIERLGTTNIFNYINGTSHPSSPYIDNLLPTNYREIIPLCDIEKNILGATAKQATTPSSRSPSMSIVTSFHSHYEFFKQTAVSVAHAIRNAPLSRVEWVVVNDDPRFTAKQLRQALPDTLTDAVRIHCDGLNRGISFRANELVSLSTHEWLIFLDCDDLIEPQALKVLCEYIEKYPHCRYFSSCTIDIDAEGRELRYRWRNSHPEAIAREGMIASHLKALRRDLFQDLGGFRPEVTGCQDYDFALRAASHEPIGFLPDFLYRYRYHQQSQSVSQSSQQERTTQSLLVQHCREALGKRSQLQHGSAPRTTTPIISAPLASRYNASSTYAGVVVVRTQGKRLTTLTEALLSVSQQQPACLPIVVVHSTIEDAHSVVELCNRIVPEFVVLHAAQTHRKRGYPWNAAVQWACDAQLNVTFLSFLDDDDVYYPFFAAKMCEALHLSNADVVHASSNRRLPPHDASLGYNPLPAICLAIDNFIPNNAYAVRLSALRAIRPLVSENIDALEDWQFLLKLFFGGCQFYAIGDVLCEFRLHSDGNRQDKELPHLWRLAELQIRAEIEVLVKKLTRADLYASILDFNYGGRSPLSNFEQGMLVEARHFIDTQAPEPS